MSTRLAEVGLKLIKILIEIHNQHVTTKSNMARHFANEIAVASTEGLITTLTLEGHYGNRWFLTAKGLQFLVGAMEERMDIIGQNGNDGLHYNVVDCREQLNEEVGC